jgi:hypothetical protein
VVATVRWDCGRITVLEDRPRASSASLPSAEASQRAVRRIGGARSHNLLCRHWADCSCLPVPGCPACIRRSDRTSRDNSLRQRQSGLRSPFASRSCDTQRPPTHKRVASGALRGASGAAVFAWSDRIKNVSQTQYPWAHSHPTFHMQGRAPPRATLGRSNCQNPRCRLPHNQC